MRRSTAIVILLLALAALPAWSSSVTVNWDGSGDYTTIDAAVLFATSTGIDTIRIAEGTYSGESNTGTTINTSPLVIESISGAALTIIDGEDSDYAFRFESGADSTTVVRGLTFDHCHYVANGGAIQTALGASPTIDSCVFEACSTDLNGGAAYFHQSSSVVRDCIFASNSAVYRGGAAYCYDGGVTFRRCTFRSNVSSEAYGGGAIHANTSADLYSDCTFVGNVYGAVSLYNCPLSVVANCIFFGTQSGAAVVNTSGSETAEVVHCVSYANSPTDSLACHHHDNLFVNPLFCEVATHDYTLCADSQCLPEVNSWGELVGASDAGCAACDTPVREASWGSLKGLFR